MTTTDRDSLKAKLAASAYSARLGHCYRMYEAACEGIVLKGNFYNLPLPERMQWEEKARKAVVFTPFMGVGSECYGALANGRRAIGVDLKPTYYNQAVRNLADVKADNHDDQTSIFDVIEVAEDHLDEGVAIDEDRRRKMIKKSHQGC
jgi:hypothetical protein